MTVRLYVCSSLSDCPPLRYDRTAPEVSEGEGSYALRFNRWFLENFKLCLLLLVFQSGKAFTVEGNTHTHTHTHTHTREKQVFLVGFSLIFPRFPRISQNPDKILVYLITKI